jgi:ABC-type lipoprotein export system ATPase subunit
VTPSSVWALRRKIAWVAQEPELGNGRALEVLERPFQYRSNRERAGNLKRTAELAGALGLDEGLLHQPVRELSGGEKQRVAILSALLLERPVLLLDEAASALDPESRDAAAELLRSLVGTTILSVSHNVEKFHLGGEIVAVGPPEARDG